MKPDAISILVVSGRDDDVAYLRHALARVAAAAGCRVHSVADIDSALRFLAGAAADVVLLDMGMAQYQAAFARLKDARSDLPIIVLSNHDDLDAAAAAVQYGAQDYLVREKDDGNIILRSILYAMQRERVEEALRRAYDELELKVQERTQSLHQVNRMLKVEIAEHERTARQLRGEHEFNRAILDALDAMVLVLDAAGVVRAVNRKFELKTGRGADAVIGQDLQELVPFLAAADSHADFMQLVRQPGGVAALESVMVASSGARYTIAWSVTGLQDDDTGFAILTGMDVTSQRQLQALDRRRLQELAHASRLTTLGEMATEIAHEINQPLAAIASYSNSCLRLLTDPGPDLEEVRSALRQIETQALRSGQIIKHIRSFTRKDSGTVAPVDLSVLVKGIMDLIKPEVHAHEVQLRLQLQDDLASVSVDKILIEQVLLNLVRNAIEAMEGTAAERRRLTIATATAGDGASVSVTVDDTGPGFAANTDLFSPFFTTKPEGVGMGLAICQSIVQSYGGRIWSESNDEGGARLRFTLPLVRD